MIATAPGKLIVTGEYAVLDGAPALVALADEIAKRHGADHPTAPGKLILTGEYAVLDGAPALVIAVNRRVVSRRGGPRGASPFLSRTPLVKEMQS